MGADIKLKDLFGQTQTEQDISTVSVPKADGTGREFYVKRPVIYYNLVASPPYAPESTEDIPIFWNVGDGPLWGDVPNDRGNCGGGVHAPIAGKTTKPIIYIQVEKYLQGVTADNTGKAELIYLYETLAGAALLEVRGKTGTADFTAQPGWGQLIQGTDGQTYTYTQLTDLSGIAIGIEQPNKIIDQRLFYSFLMEKTNSAVAYTAVKNGAYTIVPPAESSGISAVSLTVDVPESEPNLQDKSVAITANGTQEFSADTGYDGIKKLTATVNVAGGGGNDYYLLKNPQGDMPTYPNSSKVFVRTDAVIASGFKPYIYSLGNSNANEAYGIPVTTMVNFCFKEPTADIYANRILFINSASAATLSQDVLQMFLGSSWTFGAMTLAVGWNVCTFTVNDSGTTTAATCTATTIDAINMTLQGYGGIPKNNFDWAAMDAYTLSFFKDAAEPAGADAKSWVFTNGVASISQADFNKYLAPGVVAAIFINVPLEPVGGTGYSQMQNVMRSASGEIGDGSAQLVFAGEEYSLDETADPKILTPTVGGFGIISRASADADFVLSYVNAYGNTITPAFTSNGVQVTLYAQLLQL